MVWRRGETKEKLESIHPLPQQYKEIMQEQVYLDNNDTSYILTSVEFFYIRFLSVEAIYYSLPISNKKLTHFEVRLCYL